MVQPADRAAPRSDRSQVTATQSMFFVEVEKEMAEYRAVAKINNDHQKGVEPAGANQDLIKPILGVSVNIVNVVQIGHADFVEI